MAYISQDKKAELAPGIKAVLKKYGMKGTIGVRNHSTLVVNISQGPLDVIGNWFEIKQANPNPGTEYAKPAHLQVNTHWIGENYGGKCKEFLQELKAAMKGSTWYDRSDIQTDYFDISWYLDINIGQWDRAYVLTT